MFYLQEILQQLQNEHKPHETLHGQNSSLSSAITDYGHLPIIINNNLKTVTPPSYIENSSLNSSTTNSSAISTKLFEPISNSLSNNNSQSMNNHLTQQLDQNLNSVNFKNYFLPTADSASLQDSKHYQKSTHQQLPSDFQKFGASEFNGFDNIRHVKNGERSTQFQAINNFSSSTSPLPAPPSLSSYSSNYISILSNNNNNENKLNTNLLLDQEYQNNTFQIGNNFSLSQKPITSEQAQTKNCIFNSPTSVNSNHLIQQKPQFVKHQIPIVKQFPSSGRRSAPLFGAENSYSYNDSVLNINKAMVILIK